MKEAIKYAVNLEAGTIREDVIEALQFDYTEEYIFNSYEEARNCLLSSYKKQIFELQGKVLKLLIAKYGEVEAFRIYQEQMQKDN